MAGRESVRSRVLDARRQNPGLSAAALGRLLGLSRNSIIGVLYRAGLSVRAPGAPSERGRFEAGACRFMIDTRSPASPFGEGIGDPAWRWCGDRALPGQSWCAGHRAVVFRPATPVQDSEAGLSARFPEGEIELRPGLKRPEGPQLASAASLQSIPQRDRAAIVAGRDASANPADTR